MHIFRNPFYINIISFSIVIVIYQLGWSALYPPLSFGLILFFLITFAASFLFGSIIGKFKPLGFIQTNRDDQAINVGNTIFGIYVLYIVEFLYNNGIPLILVFTSKTYDYRDFGIRTLHPILETFSSFFSVYVFYLYLSIKDRKYLLYLFSLLIFPIILYHRGMLIMDLTSIFFVYLYYVDNIKPHVFAIISILVIVGLYLFGFAGNLRSTKNSSSEYIMEISHPTEKFKNSLVPNEYIWSYLYVTSPLANLQTTINNNPRTNSHFKEFIRTELCPDFISKRICPVPIQEQENNNLISPNFMASTVYARSYSLLGWLGVYLIFIFNACLIFIYLFLLRKINRFYVVGISILCTYVVYNTFTNMFYFSGLSFQLLYPFIISGFLFLLSMVKQKKALRN